MENLTIPDAPPQGGQPVLGGRAPPPPQQTPQLPPQMFTTAAQLLDLTDSKSKSRTTGRLLRRRGRAN